VWPAALDTANWPFRSKTWAAALWVILDRDGGDFTRTRRLGSCRFEQAVRREISKRGGQKPCLRIVRKLFQALADPTGVLAHRRGALERVQWLLEDWADTQRKLTDTETRMTAVLDELGLTTLATSIHGLSPVGAAAILAETGDPTRFATARALVKHAGLAPGRSCPAPSPAAPSSPAKDGRSSGWRPGGRSGEPCRPTPSTPPATAT
jgi:transposase